MEKRQRKVEKKRQKRKQAKKKARAGQARRRDPDTLLLGAASRSPWGPCYVSAGWDDEAEPALLTLVVTRRLPDERLVPGVALVDRTCLGIKDAHFDAPMSDAELDEMLQAFVEVHGGMEEIDVLTAQSIAYHAVDYARRCGFEPHRDFPEEIFGPRPAALAETPWRAAERPLYISGPHDNVERILATLDRQIGPDHFDFIDGDELEPDEPLAALDEQNDVDEDAIEAEVVSSTVTAKP